ncbi:MAG: preprotein translocase subunit SecE [Oscillospiraceae bacterium]|nr:preprotein translocase subunit SecE [Oscillospiraceae bacterium]
MAEEIKKEKIKFGERIKRFFRDYKSEMKKVVWPTRQQLIKNTAVVLVVIIFMAVIVGILDFAFGSGIRGLANVKSLFG